MFLHALSSPRGQKRKKRIGRGGKRGTYSGRGQKGQKARAGHRIRPAERDIVLKFPKLKGIKHQSLKSKAVALTLARLERLGKDTLVTKQTLFAHGLIKTPSARVKILGGGEVKRAFTVKRIPVSAEAKKKIEDAGGKVL